MLAEGLSLDGIPSSKKTSGVRVPLVRSDTERSAEGSGDRFRIVSAPADLLLCKVRAPGLSPHGSQTEADARIRTVDPFITSEVLYQLSYVGGETGL